MKILVIDEWLPWPLESGKKIRTYNLIRRLAKVFDICYVAYVRLPGEEDKIRIMEENGIRVFPVSDRRTIKWTPKFYYEVALNLFSAEPFSSTYHISDEFIDIMRSVIYNEKPDLVHCEWTNYAPLLEYAGSLPSVISAHNVESDIWRRFGEHGSSIFKRILGNSQAKKIERLERKWYPRATMCIAVSPEDQKVIQGYGSNVRLVENGVDISYYNNSNNELIDKNSIIFTASFDTFSNQDGAEYLVKEIYPIIKTEIPGINLWLVGKDPSYVLRSFPEMDASVHVTGTVEDVRPYIARSAVCIVPLRIGGGSRLKILEALAMKKAVVSTTVGAEGLSITDGDNILIADTPERFSKCVVDCLLDNKKCEQLGKKGYQLISERYNWDRLAEYQEKIWNEVILS